MSLEEQIMEMVYIIVQPLLFPARRQNYTGVLKRKQEVLLDNRIDGVTISFLEDAMNAVKKKVPTAFEVLNLFTIMNARLKNSSPIAAYADANKQVYFNSGENHIYDLISFSPNYLNDNFQCNKYLPLDCGQGFFAHEIGHLLFDKFIDTSKKAFSEFQKINAQRDKNPLEIIDTPDVFRIKGFVNLYASAFNYTVSRKDKKSLRKRLTSAIEISVENNTIQLCDSLITLLNIHNTRIENAYQKIVPLLFSFKRLRESFFSSPLNEDIAETFAYWVLDRNYADDDIFVQEKIKVIKHVLGKQYGFPPHCSKQS